MITWIDSNKEKLEIGYLKIKNEETRETIKNISSTLYLDLKDKSDIQNRLEDAVQEIHSQISQDFKGLFGHEQHLYPYTFFPFSLKEKSDQLKHLESYLLNFSLQSKIGMAAPYVINQYLVSEIYNSYLVKRCW